MNEDIRDIISVDNHDDDDDCKNIQNKKKTRYELKVAYYHKMKEKMKKFHHL